LQYLSRPWGVLIILLTISVLIIACGGFDPREGNTDINGNYTECYRISGPGMVEPIEGYAAKVPNPHSSFVIQTKDGRTIISPKKRYLTIEKIDCNTLK